MSTLDMELVDYITVGIKIVLVCYGYARLLYAKELLDVTRWGLILIVFAMMQ